MLNPPGCQCNVCRDCLHHHFEVVIRERYVRNMVCPVCGQPDIDNSPQTDTHFQLLSIMVTYSVVSLSLLQFFVIFPSLTALRNVKTYLFTYLSGDNSSTCSCSSWPAFPISLQSLLSIELFHWSGGSSLGRPFRAFGDHLDLKIIRSSSTPAGSVRKQKY